MLFGGIDEAGYGPLLGPLSIVGVAAEADDQATLKQGFRRGRTGAKDSKQVHVSGDIGAIEAVALPAIAWFAGRMPTTALDCFGLLGEGETAHLGVPWMMAAAGLTLPVAATMLKPWRLPGVEPRGLHGRLIQPREHNLATRAGTNKADLELAAVGALLKAIVRLDQAGEVVVDRLGGRRYYHPFLQSLWPVAMVMIETEIPMISGYQVLGANASTSVSFCVGGESRSPLTAAASCIAKYARELHMVLLNRWWSGRRPELKHTAGYARDAARWLDEVGGAEIEPLRDLLVRASLGNDDREDSSGAGAGG